MIECKKYALKRQNQALDAKSKAWLIGFGLEGKPSEKA
ncbi:hypothetical protein VVMO6_03136 [Vibrio vulnificus MO6-24/O]|nr:hypothetical protein VVMO6_03136 [Vibrio vulnificus MO6-24/O]